MELLKGERMILIDKDIVKLNFDEDDVEHLKEQLALAKEEIERLKYELKAEKGKTDRLKDYYESVISGYRRSVEDARIVIKEMETAIANRMRSLADN